MKRALPLLCALSACSLRAPRVESTPCSSTAQCDRPAVCFLGECRGHSSALTLVAAEVRPANDSALGVVQVSGIDLHQSVVHDFVLVPAVVVSGSVTQAQDAAASVVPNALVTFADQAPAIPDRVQEVLIRTDASGAFPANTRLPQGAWDVLVNPPAYPPLPPYRPAAPLQTSTPTLDLVLPRVGSLVQFQAVLTADGGVLSGADVTAVDATGNALSASASVQADGGFSLSLPPNTPLPPNPTNYYLQVGPTPTVVDGGMAATTLAPLPNYDHLPPTTPAVDVTLTAVATLQGKVLDGSGNPISGARVYARSDGMRWSLSRSTSTLTDGSYSLSLRVGDYLVEAAPAASPDGPAVSGEQMKSLLPAGGMLDLTCPAKVRGFGLIVRTDGSAVGANFQITATRFADHLLTARIAYSTPTDAAGIWRITADPGRYRVEVVPAADTGLPRKVVQIELAAPANNLEVQLPPIAISPPLVARGTVCSASTAPAANGAGCAQGDPVVANATVSFYALDAQGHSVLLGSAPTDAKGHYQAVLPDVAQPGAATADD